ncbi:hypothetical protein A2U01_0084896, partial [Trifolium medium]|nr:hypothetical protein [Trifolium medium]
KGTIGPALGALYKLSCTGEPGTTPLRWTFTAHDDGLLAIQPLLINRLDQWPRLWET